MKYNKEDHFKVTETYVSGGYERVRGEFFCVLTEETYDTMGAYRNKIRHIKPKMTFEEIYVMYYKRDDEGLCEGCGKPTRFQNLLKGYRRFCSDLCAGRCEEKRRIVSNRFVGHPEKAELSHERRRETLSTWTEEQKQRTRDRRMATVEERFGFDYLSKRTQQQWANTPEDKKREIFERIGNTKAKRLKDCDTDYSYKTTNKLVQLADKTFHCQGFEDSVLRALVDRYGVDSVRVGKDVPRISYSGNKSGIYRPDIFFAPCNLIIEVKSDFTFMSQIDDRYDRNIEKQVSTINAGFDHLFVVLKSVEKTREMRQDDKLELYEFIDKTISSQALHGEKVQRLSGDSEYRPNAIGSGSWEGPQRGL